MDWQHGLDSEVRTLASSLSRLASNPDPAINCQPGVSQAGWFINMCVQYLRWTLNWTSRLPALVGGCWRSHGVLLEEQSSYRHHREQITNSYPNLWRVLHQRHSQWCCPTALCCIRTKKKKPVYVLCLIMISGSKTSNNLFYHIFLYRHGDHWLWVQVLFHTITHLLQILCVCLCACMRAW